MKDILKAEQCICGAKLEPGSPEIKKVASLLEKAANQLMRDRITKVRARLASLKTERAKAPLRLTKAKENLTDANDEYDRNEAQLVEISKKLKNINFQDIAKRERRRGELSDELRDIDRKIGAYTSNIENTERETNRISKEINELAKQDKQTAIYGSRRKVCDNIKVKLELQLVAEEKQARGVLRSQIGRILKATTRKVLKLRMTEDYVISLLNSDGIVLPKSSGRKSTLGTCLHSRANRFCQGAKKSQGLQTFARHDCTASSRLTIWAVR